MALIFNGPGRRAGQRAKLSRSYYNPGTLPYQNGLIQSHSVSAKSLILRVAMVQLCALAMAAICPSAMLMGLPRFHHLSDDVGIDQYH